MNVTGKTEFFDLLGVSLDQNRQLKSELQTQPLPPPHTGAPWAGQVFSRRNSELRTLKFEVKLRRSIFWIEHESSKFRTQPNTVFFFCFFFPPTPKFEARLQRSKFHSRSSKISRKSFFGSIPSGEEGGSVGSRRSKNGLSSVKSIAGQSKQISTELKLPRFASSTRKKPRQDVSVLIMFCRHARSGIKTVGGKGVFMPLLCALGDSKGPCKG